MTDNIVNPTEYVNALNTWVEAKEAEREANKRRMEAEEKLLNAVNIYKKGTNRFTDGLNIVTGEVESWDNQRISHAYESWISHPGWFCDEDMNDLKEFPFERQWKPKKEVLNEIKESMPQIYKAHFEPALTVKPKKPYFSVKL